MDDGRVPTVDEAERLLRVGAEANAGPWADHSRMVAAAARAIAAHHPQLDEQRAYVLGLLHDIGRQTGGPGVADVRHILDGYGLMHEAGFDGCARICLTHSFPIKDVGAFASPWDCPAEERQFVQEYLDGIEYSTDDRLIQLCDSLAQATGFCLIEKRLVDIALRHGFNDLTIAKWRAILELRRELDEAVGGSVYRLLPGVVEHTFGIAPGSSPSNR